MNKDPAELIEGAISLLAGYSSRNGYPLSTLIETVVGDLQLALDALRWRKWPEEKPKLGGEYLAVWVNSEDGYRAVGELVYAQSGKWDDCRGAWVVTHWRPLPAPPKEEK